MTEYFIEESGEKIIEYNPEDLYGKYATIVSLTDKRVVAFGKDRLGVYRQTVQRGYKDPIIFYLPKKGEIFIFNSGLEKRVA